MTETIDSNTTASAYKKYIPVLTAICCLASIVLFIGINLEDRIDNWEVYKKWGSPSLTDIFNGSYWGLFSSNFLHTEIWHIACNLYWLWILGKKIEFESNKNYYGLLIFSSALVSSLAELSFSDTTGIGLSGIGYALFGFVFIKSKTSEAYKNYLDRRTINLFIFWLLLCIILTQARAWNVGNAAHIGGLLWGMALAYISKFDKYKQWAAGLVLFSVLVSSIFWTPFSTSWLSYQAFELHKKQKLDEAVVIYKKILRRDPNNQFAKTNLTQLEIYELEKKAFELHKNGNIAEAMLIYKQILSKDPDNQLAKTNLRQLEIYELQQKALELHTNKKYNEARQIYNQILNIDKENEWARENLKKLPDE